VHTEPVRETRSYQRVNSNGQLDWIECARICRGDVALDVFDQAVAGILKWCTECGIQSRVVTLAAKTMSFAFAKEAHVEVAESSVYDLNLILGQGHGIVEFDIFEVVCVIRSGAYRLKVSLGSLKLRSCLQARL